MIDENKIRVAAEKRFWRYSNSAKVKNCLSVGFVCGIEWYKQNLWHDASEKPEDGTPLLFLFRNSDGYEGYGVLCNYAKHTWNNTRNGYNVVRWAYISDLLTKGGERCM